MVVNTAYCPPSRKTYRKLKNVTRTQNWLAVLCLSSSSSSFLPKRSFTANSHQGCSFAKGRSSTANSGTKVAVLPELNRCGSLPLLPAHNLSLASERTLKDLKRFWASTRRRGEWIWLAGPSGLHRNSPQGLSISSIEVFNQMRDPEMPITLCSHLSFMDRYWIMNGWEDGAPESKFARFGFWFRCSIEYLSLYFTVSTAVEQVVAFALVTQRARVRSPVGTGFLSEVFSGFFLTCKTNVRKL